MLKYIVNFSVYFYGYDLMTLKWDKYAMICDSFENIQSISTDKRKKNYNFVTQSSKAKFIEVVKISCK